MMISSQLFCCPFEPIRRKLVGGHHSTGSLEPKNSSDDSRESAAGVKNLYSN
jgi:hypothetical protein